MFNRNVCSAFFFLAMLVLPYQRLSAGPSDFTSRIISLSRVIVTPEKYVDLKIQTFGYFWNAGEGPKGGARGAICQTLDDIKFGIYADCIGVQAEKKFLDQFKEADRKMVQVTGRFKDADTLSFGDSVGTLEDVSRLNTLRVVHAEN